MSRRGCLAIGLTLLLVLTMAAVVSAQVLDQQRLTMRIHVSAMQRLQVIEPVAISVSYPWEGADQGKPLEIRNVGIVRLQSNAGWVLYPVLATDTRFRVSIRPSGDPTARWQVVSGRNSWFAGAMGSYDLSFDIRIEALDSDRPRSDDVIEVGFTTSYL